MALSRGGTFVSASAAYFSKGGFVIDIGTVLRESSATESADALTLLSSSSPVSIICAFTSRLNEKIRTRHA